MPIIEKLTGQCACGAVSFTARGPFRDGLACHCETCRRQSGHFIVATTAEPGRLAVHETGELAWYQATPHARRGFCRTCGSLLFWEPADQAYMAIMLGSVDDPGDIRLACHIFVREKGVYYEIADGLPARDTE